MILQEEELLGVRNRLCTSLRRDNNEGKTISKTNVRKIIKRKGKVMVICENPKHKQKQG